MKVKLAAQLLSASVTDSLEFLLNDLKYPKFKGCSSIIEFLRNIDRLLKFSNSRDPFRKVFKAPISNFNLTMQENTFESICKYLLKLKNTNNQWLYFHQCKTFIVGFICTGKPILTIAKELLDRNKN